MDGVKAEDVKIYLVDEKTGEKTELSFKLSDDKKTYETETEKLGIFAVCTDEKLPTKYILYYKKIVRCILATIICLCYINIIEANINTDIYGEILWTLNSLNFL